MWDKFASRLFVTKLQLAEKNSRYLNEFNLGFIKDMREKYTRREAALDLGLDPEKAWEPTVKQLNYLSSITREFE